MIFLIPYASDRRRKRLPTATIALLVANSVAYFGMSHLPERAQYSAAMRFGFVPSGGQVWSLFTSMFLHSGLDHLGFNMLFLWIFGSIVEDVLGPAVFLAFYFGSHLGATLLHSSMLALFDPYGLQKPVLGASGAIAGVLGLSALRFYKTRIKVWYWILIIWWGTFSVGAAAFLGIWLLMELSQGIIGLAAAHAASGYDVSGGIANWAHIGGFAFGMLGAALIKLPEEGRQEYLLEEVKREGARASESAWQAARELSRLGSPDPAFWRAYGRLCLGRRDADAAAEAFMTAVRLLLKRQDRAEATRAYRELLSAFPEAVLPAREQLAVATALESQWQNADAAGALERFLEKYPGTPEAQLALVRLAELSAEKLGNKVLARQLFTRLLQDWPDSEWADHARRRLIQLA